MRKQLITAGGREREREREGGREGERQRERERERERGRSIGIAPNADGCGGVFTFRGRQQREGERGKERYIRAGWSKRKQSNPENGP